MIFLIIMAVTRGPQTRVVYSSYIHKIYHIKKTGQQCQLTPLPYYVQHQVATVINGTPATCGGEILSGQTLNCFKLDNKTKTWIQVLPLNLFL